MHDTSFPISSAFHLHSSLLWLLTCSTQACARFILGMVDKTLHKLSQKGPNRKIIPFLCHILPQFINM